MNNLINMKNTTKLVIFGIIVCMILLILGNKENQQINQNITKKEESSNILKTVSNDIFGPDIKQGEYLNTSNMDFIKYFLQNMEINNGKLKYSPLYDIKSFNKELKEINREEFLYILRNIEYNTSNIKQDPTEILETLEGNCSSITLFIVNWLLVNYNPNEYKYYMSIIEESTNDANYDRHMYLLLKRDGKQSKRIDFSEENNLELVDYLNKFITE